MAGTATSRPRLVALDTNILFHLAEDYAPAHNLVRVLVKRGFTPIITETVIQELGAAAEKGQTERHRRSASLALMTLRENGIQPATLKPVGNGICGIVADLIATRGLLPEEERNDAYVFIESSFYAVSMLVTWDHHLLDAPNSALNEVLKSFDLAPVQIVHPKILLGYDC